MMNKLFSVIIPTMWMSEHIHSLLGLLISNTYIGEIIIIDNNPKLRKSLPTSNKLIVIDNGENNFVNPSWNIGFSICKYKLILCNDDIQIKNLDGLLTIFNNTDYDLLGVAINESTDEMFVEEYNQEPTNSFGCFMFVKNYNYIPEKYKIWVGDNLLIENSKKVGIVKNSTVLTTRSETLKKIPHLKTDIATNDHVIYFQEKKLRKTLDKLNVLVVLVNYGVEQLGYLEQVVKEIRTFQKYQTKVIVHSNIPIDIEGIDEVKIYNNLKDYQLLPLTCRTTIWENRNDYDIFIYGENDLLIKEIHIDKHIEYSEILPKDRIPGLLRYEQNDDDIFFPDYHANYDWDFGSLESYDNKRFAHFTNLHQATFILNKEQLLKIGSEYDFTQFFGKSHYSVKCKVCTDLYQFTTYKKVICVSEIKSNIIHHLSNVYINGDKGRRKNQRSDFDRMKKSLLKLMGYNFDSNGDTFSDENNQQKKELSIIIPTFKNTVYLSETLQSIIKSCHSLSCEILIGIDSCYETLDYITNKTFDNRIKFYFFPEKSGPYIVRNSLVNIAKSDILFFFDSDDIMKESLISEILNKMKNNDFIKPMYSEFTEIPDPNIVKTATFGECQFSIKKELFLSMNGFEPWLVAADTDFMKRLYKNHKKFDYTSNVSFYKRVHSNSLTQKKETGFTSVIRNEYWKKIQSKKTFGPLPELVTSTFYEVRTKKIYESKPSSTFMFKEKKDISALFKHRKIGDFEELNVVLTKNVKENPKPISQPSKPKVVKTEPILNKNAVRQNLAKLSIKKK